jgi:hypothetical protein
LANQPNDVVDVHLIGHSRGTVVISQASLRLSANPGPTAVRLGFLKMTILDPHPARNRGTLSQGLDELNNGTGVSWVGGFSFNPGGWLARTVATGILDFQSRANDPEVVIGRTVDAVEVFRQELPWNRGGFLERLTWVNLWASPWTAIFNPFLRPVTLVVDVGALGIGHTEVSTWYLNNVRR